MITLDPQRRPRHAVILCHPDRKSFNASVAERYIRTVELMGHETVLRDLYAMHFDPVLKDEERPGTADFMMAGDVAEELSVIAGCDAFILVYPIWFGLPPAMLKGYVDRVLGAAFPFRHVQNRTTHPLLTGKKMLSFSSSGTSQQWLDEQGAWISLRTVFDKYLEHAFSMTSSDHVHFSPIIDGISQRFVNEELLRVEQAAKKLCASFLVPSRKDRAAQPENG
ncbi:NAD(P)H-dependent oxidoreductase [Rhizorhabdus sp.]|uniref:NAD(P)H-dependent oxidoreductase n=1 Tax=Rhizorhabdus sp. TaxID=1968843 RepID=UPI0019AE765E|nr:NAD(P)H-dependent oxidoreductase [Rhizorhabdus sp.]MBD3761904.1 NAD(P)H-dependent oxidoreductase [Rhizorhabdus sp.]